jgi:hypothetical protein
VATVGKLTVGLGACGALLVVLWTPFVGLGHAEGPLPSASACPPSPTLPASGAPANATASAAARATSPYRPSAEEVVACVGSQEISGATFSHWAVVADRADSGPHRHSLAEPNHAEMAQVMGFLIAADWVLGEAAALHIEVSPAAVRHRLDQLSRAQFHKPERFRAFLRSTGQKLGDLLLRVRLSMLTTRIQEQITGHGSAHTKERRLARFIKHFKSKWKAQTYCQAPYTVSNCGHTASSL